jgi:hypothetical protein
MQPTLGPGQSTDHSVASTGPPPQVSSSGFHPTPSRLDALIDFNTPSKVFAVTYDLITAYRCVAEILEPREGTNGWAALGDHWRYWGDTGATVKFERFWTWIPFLVSLAGHV